MTDKANPPFNVGGENRVNDGWQSLLPALDGRANEKGFVQSLSQSGCAVHVGSQVRDNNVLADWLSVLDHNYRRAQRDPDKSIHVSESGRVFEIDERGVGQVRDSSPDIQLGRFGTLYAASLGHSQSPSLKARLQRAFRAFVNEWRRS